MGGSSSAEPSLTVTKEESEIVESELREDWITSFKRALAADMPYYHELRAIIDDAQLVLEERESASATSEPEYALRWEEPYMNGLWKAVMEFADEAFFEEDIFFIVDIEKAKADYANMVHSDETPAALSARMAKSKKWSEFKRHMEYVYNDIVSQGLNVGDARPLFGRDIDFTAFWTPDHFDPRVAPWSSVDKAVVKKLATTITGANSGRPFVKSEAFKKWEYDGTKTGFMGYMEAKTKKEGGKARAAFESDKIGGYHLYKEVTRKGRAGLGEEGWNIWETEPFHAFRIWNLGGDDAYRAWKTGGDGGFEKWFLEAYWGAASARHRWTGTGRQAYKAWREGEEDYRQFTRRGPERYERWKRTEINDMYGATGSYEAWEKVRGLEGKKAAKIWADAYNGCKKSRKMKKARECTDAEKVEAATAALHKAVAAYGTEGDAAYEEYQNIIMGDTSYPYVHYSSIPYKDYNNGALLNNKDKTQSELMLSALVMVFIAVMMICCACWIWGTLVGYYCIWMERKKRVHNQEEDGTDAEKQHINHI